MVSSMPLFRSNQFTLGQNPNNLAFRKFRLPHTYSLKFDLTPAEFSRFTVPNPWKAVDTISLEFNTRPRKIHAFKAPLEIYVELLKIISESY